MKKQPLTELQRRRRYRARLVQERIPAEYRAALEADEPARKPASKPAKTLDQPPDGIFRRLPEK